MLLPRGESERAAKELADGGLCQRERGTPALSARGVLVQGRERHRRCKHAARQRDDRCAGEAAKWIGLGRPIQIPEGSGESPEVMFRAVVIVDDRQGYFDSPLMRFSISAKACFNCV
jgi:hypothetical protein